MSGKQLRRFMLTCDGCTGTLGEDCQYESASAARRDAIDRGWTMVPKRRSNGHPGAPGDPDRPWGGFDICPDCLPSFEPGFNSMVGTRAGRGAWWIKRIARLEQELEAARRVAYEKGKTA
jgi:hypothetical protein